MNPKPLHRRVREDKGFTLLEIIVALSILAVILVPLTASFISALRETNRTGQRLAASADAQRIAAAWTSDVHNVSPQGYNTDGHCEDNPDIKGSAGDEVTLVSFQWNDDPSAVGPVGVTPAENPAAIEKASWIVEGTGVDAILVRRYCRGGVTEAEELIADSFGVPGMTNPYDVLHGPTGAGDEQFCDNVECTISVTGSFNYELTVARRVAGAGNPSIVRPPCPTITGVAGANQTLAVSWLPPVLADGAPAITGYQLTISTSPTGAPIIAGKTIDAAPTDSAAVFSGLTNGTDYYVRAKSKNAFEAGFFCEPVKGTPQATAPGIPTIGTATPADTAAKVTWTAPDDDGGSPITGWVVRARNTDGTVVGETTLSGGNLTSGAVTGLENGIAVALTVAAVNARGESSESGRSNDVVPCGGSDPPPAPSLLNLNENVQFQLDWSEPFNNGCGIINYEIESSPAFAGGINRPASPWFTTAVTPPDSAPVTFTTPGLIGLTDYQFRVRALNGAQTLDGTAVPGAWSEWSEPISAIGPPNSAPPAAAWEPMLEGNLSNRINNGLNVNSIKFSWAALPNTPQFNGGSPITGYDVIIDPGDISGVTTQYRIDAGTPFQILDLGYGNLRQIDFKGTATTWDDEYIDYQARIAARNAFGVARVEDSARFTGVRAGGRPIAAPSNVKVVGLDLLADRSSVRVTWDPLEDIPSNNGGSPLKGYLVRWQPPNVNGETTHWAGGKFQSQADVANFAKGVNYEFEVVAVNELADPIENFPGAEVEDPKRGAGLAESSVFVDAPTPLVAPASSAVVLTRGPGTAGNSMVLTFPAFTSSSGSVPPTYSASCTVPSEPAVAAVAFSGLTPGANTLADAALTNGKTWRCRLTATATYPGGTVDSAFVDSNTAVPSTTPSAPTGLSVSAVSGGLSRLNWTAIPTNQNGGAAVTGYTLAVSPAVPGLSGPTVVSGASANQSASFGPLAAGTEYTFTLYASNAAGDGATATLTYTPTTSVPLAAVSNLDWTPTAPNAVKITWTPLGAPGNGNAPIEKYVVTIRNTGGGSVTSVDVLGELSSEYTFTSFAQLNAGGTAFNDYEVTVTPVNALGAGPLNSLAGVRTGGVPIGAATNLRILPRAGRADGDLQAAWTVMALNVAKLNGGSVISGYRVNFSLDGGASWSADEVCGGGNCATGGYDIGNHPDAPIRLRVRAYNANGTSPTATIIDGRTPGGPVTTGNITLVTGSGGTGRLTMTWNAYTLPNNNPTNYDYTIATEGYSVTCTSPTGVQQTYVLPTAGANTLTGLTPGATYTCILTVTAGAYAYEQNNRVTVTESRTAVAS